MMFCPFCGSQIAIPNDSFEDDDFLAFTCIMCQSELLIPKEECGIAEEEIKVFH